MSAPLPIDSPSPREQRLDSWKEIAAHFNVSARTVQSWESLYGLPVHRMPGPRGRVWSTTAELDAWRARLAEPPDPALASPSPKRSPLILALVAIALVAAVALTTRWAMRRSDQIATYRTEGSALVVSGASGRELWRYNLPAPPWELWTEDNFHAPPAALDIDGDGLKELLFPLHFKSETAPATASAGGLLCFSHSGRLLWTFSPGRPVDTGKGERFVPPYLVWTYSQVRLGAGRMALAVSSHHEYEYPGQVAIISPQGELLRQYLHSGHLSRMLVIDLNSDGTDEICLAGIANGFKRAVLVVLDPNRMQGASRERNPDYQLQRMDPPVEIARILVPRSSVNAYSNDYPVPGRLLLQGDEIMVETIQTPRPLSAALSTYFGLDLNFRRTVPAAGFETEYNQMAAKGQVRGSYKEELKALQQVEPITAPNW